MIGVFVSFSGFKSF